MLSCLTIAGVASAAEAGKPNVVIVMADDLGWGDISAYHKDSLIETPHIDKLTTQGLSFTDAHSSASVCTPSRYGLLTGRYCWRTRLKKQVLNGCSSLLIDADTPTMHAAGHPRDTFGDKDPRLESTIDHTGPPAEWMA